MLGEEGAGGEGLTCVGWLGARADEDTTQSGCGFWSLQAVTLVTHSSHCIYSPSSAEASFHVPEPWPLAWIPQNLRPLIEVFAAPQPPPKGLKSSLRSTDVLMHNCFSSGTCLIMLPQYKRSTEPST